MPINGTYSGGSASANSYSTFQELLAQLPDNTANLIVAKDIRDPVFSLWTRIDEVQVVASQSASASAYYSNANTVPISVGGISAGSSFSGTFSIQQMFDMLLYPYIPPSLSLSGGGNREFGSSPGPIALSWSVTKGSNLITSIIVNGTPVVPTGFNQSGVGSGTSTQNVNTTFNMSTSDGISTPGTSTTVTWLNARYWGTATTFAALNSAQILALSGAGIPPGKELATSRVQTRNGINGGGDYLAFAWPTAFGNPSFVINGLPNTAFTKVNSAYAFVNSFGYTASYDVWLSNTQQNSPITLFQIN